MVATLGNHMSRPEVQSEKPILYWVTDSHDARLRNLEKFEAWLKEKGYPEFEVRIDNASNNVSKKLMQGVSGVGADIIHLARDEAWFLNGTGMLEDLGPYAEKHGFTPEKTWERAQPILVVDGKQVGFPRSVSIQAYYVNEDLLARHGIESLPEHWTLEDFERIGKQFVAAANEDTGQPDVFFADGVNNQGMLRSMGGDDFNETLTLSGLGGPEYTRVLELVYQWRYVDRILPTQADLDFAAGSGTTVPRLQLFLREKYALTIGARYTLVRLREADPTFRIGAQEGPHDHFRNSPMGTGSIAIYKKSPHKDLAAYFLEYFTSEEHNMHVVEESDGMPPIPRYVETEAFLRPPDYPEEWDLHRTFEVIMRETAMPRSISPYILPSTAIRIARDFSQGQQSGLYTAEEAARLTAERINAQIRRNVEDNPALRRKYETALERQERIDERRRAGKPVPAEWIDSAFWREYYAFRGWLEEEE